jgi:hypothetical protein
MKKTVACMAVAALATTTTIGIAGSALAGSGSLGSKTCSTGSVSTTAYGNYAITFNAYIPNLGGAYTLQKGTNTSTKSWKYAYWAVPAGARVEYASRGSASNAGTLTNLSWFCDT